MTTLKENPMRFAAVTLLLALAGCVGATTDGSIDESQIVGTWTGTTVINGQTTSTNASTAISSTGTGQVFLGAVCPDNSSGPVADVTSTTAFTVVAFSCPAAAVSGCASAVLAIVAGSGNIAGGVLTLNASGTLTGCGSSVGVTIAFTGTRS
jgi:hypothetical protein